MEQIDRALILRAGHPHIKKRMRQPTQKVIVTGAAGFIGSHLCTALTKRGVQVFGIDNFDPFYSREIKTANMQRVERAARNDAENFRLIEADIRHGPAMRAAFEEIGPDAVFHIAALAGITPSVADPARYASTNVDGTINVLEAARAVGCRNVVFASSSSVYGNNSKVPFAEDDPVDMPISPYAATKRAGELICHTYAHLFGMRIAALRFFTVYGPAQRPDLAIAKFMRLIAAGEEVPMYGDGSTSRDYTYIDDIIQGVIAAQDLVCRETSQPLRAGFFRIFNLGNSHPITLAELIEAVARIVGKPARIKRLPMQPGDVERTWADLTRSHAELRYRPTTCLADGLREQWNHFSRPEAPEIYVAFNATQSTTQPARDGGQCRDR